MIQRKNFWAFIGLTLVTCGIYGIIFWVQTVKDINTILQGDGEDTTDYIVVLLLSLVTCGIYTFFWYYKLGERLSKNDSRYGLQIKETGSTYLLWMILGSFIAVGPFVGIYLLIQNINQYIDAYNAYNNYDPQSGYTL